jgi:hypothetical protein
MAYEPIQTPKWSERDALPQGDQRKIIKAADFDTEFNNIKAEFDRINRHGVVASVKYNGSQIMYAEGVSSVTPIGNNGYSVQFDSEIAEFDEHYAVQITMFVSQQNRPTVATLTGFSANSVQFTVTEFEGGSQQEPSAPVGFSMLIVDMATD